MISSEFASRANESPSFGHSNDGDSLVIRYREIEGFSL